MGGLYIGCILAIRVVQSYFSKYTSIMLPTGAVGRTKYFMITNYMAAAFALILVIINNDFSHLDAPTIIISSLSGIALTASSIFGILSVQSCTIVLNSMFSTGGLLIPCIAGIFMFGESISVWQWVAMGIFFVSSYMLIGTSKKIYPQFSLKTMLLLVGTLVANGLTMLFQKMFSLYVEGGSVSLFSFLTFFIPGVAMMIFTFIKRKSQGENDVISKKLLIYGAILALAVFIINQLATLASLIVPSVILFTFINGGATIIAAIVAAIVFREKLTVKSTAAIIMGIVSLIMIKAL